MKNKGEIFAKRESDIVFVSLFFNHNFMARAEQPGYSLDFIRKNENKDKATKEIRESQ